MRINGVVQIMRKKDATYEAIYAPLGAPLSSIPPRSFPDEQGLERFLSSALKINRREILTALYAVSRNGLYRFHDIWLSEAELEEAGK